MDGRMKEKAEATANWLDTLETQGGGVIRDLLAALAAAERENEEHKERFARAAGALGAEMGKRERAEVERDWLLAKLVYPYAGGWRVNAVTHSTPSDAVQSIVTASANDKEIRGIFDKLRAAAALPGEGESNG
jgi:hypothetical protein